MTLETHSVVATMHSGDDDINCEHTEAPTVTSVNAASYNGHNARDKLPWSSPQVYFFVSVNAMKISNAISQ